MKTIPLFFGITISLLFSLGVFFLAPIVNAHGTPSTERISVDVNGGQLMDPSYEIAISGDGRFIAFSTWSPEVIPGAPTIGGGLYVRDLLTNTIEPIAITLDGIHSYGYNPKISEDGRFVAFTSDDPNLVISDTNGFLDVFVRDRLLNVTERVSLAYNGEEQNGPTRPALDMSADGRFVVFASNASNLVEGDTNNKTDVFLYDRISETTRRVSVASDGTQGNQNSEYSVSISGNGSVIAFLSSATNFVPNTLFIGPRLYTHDLATGETSLATIDASGTPVYCMSNGGSLSYNGQLITIKTCNGIQGPNPIPRSSTFVRDRETGAITVVDVGFDGSPPTNSSSHTPIISADGRFVTFKSCATNLVPNDGYICNGGDSAGEVYVRDLINGVTHQIAVGYEGSPPNRYGYPQGISSDGRFVVFASRSTNLIPNDTNNVYDIFLRDQGIEFQATPTPSLTPSVTNTPTATQTPTATKTRTPTRTLTATRTVTATRTASATLTVSPTSTSTPTLIPPTYTATPSPTDTTTPVASHTPTVTTTASSTTTPTYPPSPSHTPTGTTTATATPTYTPTPSPSATGTVTVTATLLPTITPSVTRTITPSPSATATIAPTHTATRTVIPPTITPSVTRTLLPTGTATPTIQQRELFLPLIQGRIE